MPDDQPTRKRSPIKVLPSVEYLRECFEYDPAKGLLMWKRRPRGHFRTEVGCKIAAANYSGKVAGIVHHTGYRYVQINGIDYGAHRIVWKLMTDWEPPSEIDHINGNCADNRWCNLRAATHFEQTQNRRRPKNNTSGHRGVRRDRSGWVAKIGVNGARRHLGYFATREEAASAYERAARELHGQFYRRGDA